MLRFIRKLISAKPRIELSHPVFGNMHLQRGAKGPYWLREAYHAGELTITIDTAGEKPPTESQARLFEEIIGEPNETYRVVAAELSTQHERMHHKPVQADWRRTFRLASIGIPLEGNRLLPWEITFECLTDGTGFLYTCHFAEGSLVHVSVDT